MSKAGAKVYSINLYFIDLSWGAIQVSMCGKENTEKGW